MGKSLIISPSVKYFLVHLEFCWPVCISSIFLYLFFSSTYGVTALGFLEADPEKRIDPMAIIFPRGTKCSFFKYGPSGTVQTHDAICVLPVNIVNEKVYVFLWFWLVILSVLTVLSVIYHMAFMVSQFEKIAFFL